MVTKEHIEQLAEAEYPNLLRFRRHIHEHPEMSFQEADTSAYICSVLKQEGISYQTGVGGPYGIVARIRGDEDGPCIAFRADIDALGIQEETGLAFSSSRGGVMHACGHDLHTTILLGLARTLNQNRELIRGQVVLIFQFAEELPPGGAKPMIEAGCLDGVDRIYGLHVDDDLPYGEVGVLEGPYMAASDSFFVDIKGGGGHGSRPYDTQDTISSAAMAVLNINQITGRFISPLESAVISVCRISGGVSYNVIPAVISLAGTVRTYNSDIAAVICDKLEEAVSSACNIFHTAYDFRFKYGYPCLVNSERETGIVRTAADRAGYPCRRLLPTPVGEDFSRYLEKIPGAFFRVGVRNPEINAVYPLHHNHFQADERALKIGLEMMWQIYLTETGQ